DRTSNTLVRVKRDFAGRFENIAARKAHDEFASPGLLSAAFMEAALEDVQLGLAHCSLKSKQKSVIEASRVVNAVGVANQSVEQRAHFKQLMPIAAGTRQPRDLNAQHQADVAKPNLGDKTLEAGPVQG